MTFSMVLVFQKTTQLSVLKQMIFEHSLGQWIIASIGLGAIAIYVFLSHRQEQFYRAWLLINTAQGLPGDCGRKLAIEQLKNSGV